MLFSGLSLGWENKILLLGLIWGVNLVILTLGLSEYDVCWEVDSAVMY